MLILAANADTAQLLQVVVDLGNDCLWETILLSTPVLIIGLVVGLIISIVQAVTQIQEMTLTFVPKILVMVASLIILMPWMVQSMVDYTTSLFVRMAHPMESLTSGL